MDFCIVTIKGKNPKRPFEEILKKKIDIYDIKYKQNEIKIVIKYQDYKKIEKIKTICDISITKLIGIKRIKQLVMTYKIFFIFLSFSIITIILLSKTIFTINIKTENKTLKTLIKDELYKYNITLFSFKKNYSKLELIKESIKKDLNDKLEWLEIKTNGVDLNVNFIERKNKTIDNDNTLYDIVAKKDGYIIDMEVESGEIKKTQNDYVKKGEVIVSSYITRNDKVVGRESAKANVYAEVWYKVSLSKNITINKEYVKENKKHLTINILGKDFTIFSYKSKNNKTKNYITNSLFKISLNNEEIKAKKLVKYDDKELQKELEDIANKKILENLKEKERILYQKTLKVTKKDDKMNIEVFFKVYENIAKEETPKRIEEER